MDGQKFGLAYVMRHLHVCDSAVSEPLKMCDGIPIEISMHQDLQARNRHYIFIVTRQGVENENRNMTISKITF